VGRVRFELTTSALSELRSNQLSYRPTEGDTRDELIDAVLGSIVALYLACQREGTTIAPLPG
jgi:hypothetical protein